MYIPDTEGLQGLNKLQQGDYGVFIHLLLWRVLMQHGPCKTGPYRALVLITYHEWLVAERLTR